MIFPLNERGVGIDVRKSEVSTEAAHFNTTELTRGVEISTK